MKTLDRKLVREIWRQKGTLLAIISVLTVGVACYITMNSAYRNLSNAKLRYYRQCRMADFWIDVKKAPLAELSAVSRLPGITEINPRIVFFATVDLESSPAPLNGQVVSLPDVRGRPLNDIVLVQGGYFTARRENEVIVNDSFARKHNLFPGSTLHLLLNNRRQELFVLGTAIAAEYTYLLGPGTIIPDPAHFGVFYVKHSFAEEAFSMQGAANQIVGRLDPSVREHPDSVLRTAETLLESYGVSDVTPLKIQSSNQYLSNEINGLRTFAKILPVIFLTVAAVVLNVLMTRLARQQRMVVGTLKALGYSNAAVFMHFLKFGLVIGITGSLCGSLLGQELARLMTGIYRSIFEFPDLRNEIYLQSHAIGWGCGLGCSLLGCVIGANSALRLQPAEAMRAEPPRRGGHVLLERWRAVWQALTATWRMVLRNFFRNKIRTGAGIFAAAMGTCLMVNGFMMMHGTRTIIDFQLRKVMRSDLDLAFQRECSDAALWELRSLPQVEYAEPTLNVACTFIHGPYQRKGAITGLVARSRLTVPRNASAVPLRLPAAGITMNRHLASLLHVKQGDTITVVTVKGERRARELPVVQITDGFMGLAAYAELDWLSHMIDEERAMNGAQLLVRGNEREREALYREIKQMPAVEAVSARQDMIDSLENTLLKTQNAFISMFVMFAGAIFFSAVLNASLVSLAERQREVATLLALGYTPWQVGNLFLRESMLANVLGTAAGVPLGYMLTAYIAHAYANDLLRFPVMLAPWNWQVAALFSLVYALAAHGVVQFQIFRMDYVEALKVKE